MVHVLKELRHGRLLHLLFSITNTQNLLAMQQHSSSHTALMYVCILLNHLASAALGWWSPEQILTGQQFDISKFLPFSFYEPVYYQSQSNKFPSGSNKEQGWWVGIATHVVMR
jgi:hypothetical protein